MEPMLATPADPPGTLPGGPAWAFEVKWDGVRAIADTRDGVRLLSRRGADVTPAYPELESLAALPGLLLDGEVVAMAGGVPSFSALADRMHVRDARRARALAASKPVTYLVFDVLARDGEDLTALPYDERRSVLDALAEQGLPEHVQLSPVYDDGAQLWAVTEQHGLEGVVAKRRASTYQPGRRSRDWVKAPHRRTRAALVGGWRSESTGSGRLGSILVGAPDRDGTLRYLGRAGSGLTGQRAQDLRRVLEAAARDDAPFVDVPREDARGTLWCEPGVVIDLLYLTRTPDGRLRQPVVRGVRTDTDPDPWEQA